MDNTDNSTSRPPAQSTLILMRADIAALMKPADYLESAHEAFSEAARGRIKAPPPMYVAGTGGGFHAKGAYFARDGGEDYAAIKLNSNFAGNRESVGLPSIQGALLLFEARHGRLLAIMDSIEITMMRTAAAAALAATHLARRDSAVLTICGCGELARAVLIALADVLPLARVHAWDRLPAVAEEFAGDMSARLGLAVSATPNMTVATLESDVIATCSSAKSAFLGADDVRPGTFIAAMGADHADKNELRPRLMAHAKIVVDSVEQAMTMGDLNHALAEGAMQASHVHATLGELASGSKPGRHDKDEITVFDSTGSGIQDVTAAVRIYQRALHNPDSLRIALAS